MNDAAKPRFKFQYANEIVGTFVLLAVLVLVVALVSMARSRKWTEQTRHLHVKLPDASLGMEEGAAVELAGMPIGIVDKIRIDELGRITADVTLKGDFIRFIRNDSNVTVKQRYKISGDVFLDFTTGKGIEVEEGYDGFVAERDQDPSAILSELRQNLQESHKLLATLNSPDGSVQRTLASMQQISGAIARGEGVAGRLLTDPNTAKDFDKLLPQVNSSLAEVNAALKELHKTTEALAQLSKEETTQLPALMEETHKTMEQMRIVLEDLQKTTAKLPEVVASSNAVLNDVHKTTDKLPQMMQSVQTSLDGLPPLLLQVQETMRQSQRLVEGIQRHWLVSSYVPQETTGKRIRPENLGGGSQ